LGLHEILFRVLADLFDRVLGTQAAPERLLVLVTAASALVAVSIRAVWHVTRNAVTIAHEGGHAVVAVLVGRRLQSIRFQSDTSGLTVTKGKPHGLGMVLTLLVGYVAPALVGVAGAVLLWRHHITMLLWLTIVLLFAVLVMTRNLYGIIAVLALGGIVFAVSWFGGATLQAAFAYAGVWFLLFGAVRPIFELARARRKGKAGDSDVDQLARLTHVPAGVWLFVYLLINVAALVAGAILLDVLPRAWLGL
jgi:hypothetical protein